ncbi:MAG: helix-turn-helix domain-containing protein [Chloroflexota bacterium]|nr:helix-turn-helix domain-containing protein [Chloroflexota bacterium]
MHDQTLPLLLKAEEAARMLSLGRSKVFEMLATGELPRVRIGRKVRIRRVDLEKWVEDHAVDQTDRQLQS